MGEGLQQAAGDARGDHGVACGHAADCCEQVLGSGVLQKEAGCSGAQRGEGVLVEVEGGQDEHPRVREFLGDPAGGLDAVGAGHADVHQDDVGPQPAGQLQGLGAVRRLADRVHVGLGVEDHAERQAQQRLVVGEQDADRHAAPSSGGSRSRRAKTRQPPPGRGPAWRAPP